MAKTEDLEKLIDSEYIFHKIKKENIAHHTDTFYSEAIEYQCKNCDGYNIKCKHYICKDDYSITKYI